MSSLGMRPDHNPSHGAQAAAATLRVLLVEDSADDAELLRHMLRKAYRGLQLEQVDGAASMQAALQRQTWDLVISDYNLPGFSAEEALRLARQRLPETPFIVVSGYVGEEAAVALMRAGADDYVMKENLRRLEPAVARSLKDAQARRQRQAALHALHESEARFKAIAANIPGMVFQLTMDEQGDLGFAYVSGGSQALLGVSPQDLHDDCELFLGRLEPGDRLSLEAALRHSGAALEDCYWEGRALDPQGGDAKWLRLACSPRWLDPRLVLWDGLVNDVTAAKAREAELRRSRQELSRMSLHVETVKEEERARIARDVHDDLGGTLTAIKIELMRLKQGLDGADKRAAARLLDAEGLLDHAMEATRRIATELRPGILDLGIGAAVDWQCREFARRTDTPCTLSGSAVAAELDVDPAISIALFRIFQEALTNIAKHAQARQVTVTLELEEDRLRLSVRDDGRGVLSTDLEKVNAYGLRGMRERAAALHGELEILGLAPGTELRLLLPLRHAPTPEERAAARPFRRRWDAQTRGRIRLDARPGPAP